MSNSADNNARMETLELKLMDLELSVQQLNDVVLRQFQDIERLQQFSTGLEKRLASMGENNGAAPSASDEVPPHY